MNINIAEIVIDSLIMSWTVFYIGAKFLNQKNDYKNRKFWIPYILYTAYIVISYIVTNNFSRVFVSFTVLSFVFAILHNISFVKGIVLGFIVTCYAFLSETIVALIITIIFKENIIEVSAIENIIYNIIVVLVMIGMTRIKTLNSISDKLLKRFDIENNKIVLIFTILSLITLALILYYIYFEINLVLALILGIILIVIFTTVTLGLFTEKIGNYRLKTEYDIILDNLSEYEKMYSLQRMKNHEYKNDLSVLRGMVSKEDKTALAYIDEIINFRSCKKHNWMETLKMIPEGGLQGILYYKLLKMEDLKITIDFTTSSSFSMATYSKLPEKIKIRICKLLGIYLDNAIQAVENLTTKKVYIEINQTKEFIIFKVANNFSGQIDLGRISEKGYTTKSRGHGYGLAIAKEILDSEPALKNTTSIVKDKFIQEIKIKKCR